MFFFQWFILQLRVFKNQIKEKKGYFLFQDFFHKALLFLIIALLYFFLISLFNFSVKRGLAAFDFACLLFSFSLLLFLPLLIYNTIICSLSFFFQKEEITFYFSLGVNPTQVFLVKFWQVFFHTTKIAFFVILTFIFSLQTYFGLSPTVYLSGIISTLFFLIIPVCLAVIFVCLLSRFISFVRAKGVLIVIGLLIGSVALSIIRLMLPERLITAQGKIRLLSFLENLHKPWMTILPGEWLTNILASHYHKDLRGVFFNLSALTIVALILSILTYLIAKTFYLHIWSESITVPQVKIKEFRWQVLLKFFPSSIHTFIKKDLLSFYRNTVERGSLLIFIPLAFIYFYSIYVLKLQLHSYPGLFSFSYLYLFNLFCSSVVVGGLSGRWVFPSISAETNNFRLIKFLPFALKGFLKEKFWLGFLPLLILAEILVIFSCFILNLRPVYVIIASLMTVILTLGIVAIALILGVKRADFSIKEPLEFALSYEGFLYLVWVFTFVVITILLFALPFTQFLRRGFSSSFLLFSTLFLMGVSSIFYYLYLSYKGSVLELERKDV